MSYASIDDLKAASGDDSIAANDARALRLLEFADAKIDAFCGQSFPIAPATDVPVIVVQVAAAVAARAWVNPAGAQTTQETAGPFAEMTTYASGQSMASVPMALRASEKEDLSRYKVRRSGIGTISTTRPVGATETNWVAVAGGGKPFPWSNPDDL